MTLHELLNYCPLHRLINKHVLKKVDVFVKQEDIDQGERGMGTKCPVHLALKRAGINGHVTYSRVELPNLGGNKTIKLPDEARRFIVDFDSMKPVKPFNFTLSLR